MNKAQKISGIRRRGQQPTNIDILVGRIIKERREELGISQEVLADAAGITQQQLTKYEKGINRASASRLLDIANSLEVPPAYFFEGTGHTMRRRDRSIIVFMSNARQILPKYEDEIRRAIADPETANKMLLALQVG